MLYRQDRRFINHIGQIRAHGSGSSQGNGVKIHRLVQKHFLGVHFQNIHPSFQIRTVHNDPPVKPSRAQKRRIQDFRPVGGSQNQKSFGAVEAVHFRQQLIQGLLSLIVASVMGVPGFSDSIDLIDKDNAGGAFLGLLKKVPDSGSSHAHKHLHKLRTGKREKGHMRLSRHCLCQQGLSGSRRSHQQRAFWQLSADFGIILRIMEKIHYLLKGFLGLVLTGYILKSNPRFLLHIGTGFAFSHSHEAAAFIHITHYQAEAHHHQKQRHDNTHEG